MFPTEREMEKEIRKAWVWILPTIVLIGIILVGLVSYARTYEHRVLPGVHIGSISIGGMEQSDLTAFLHTMEEKISKEGVSFSFDINNRHEQFTLLPGIVSDGNILDYLVIDVDAETERLLSYGKEGNAFVRAWRALASRIARPHLVLEHAAVNTDDLLEAVTDEIEPFSQPPRNAGIQIDTTVPVSYTMTTATPGIVFNLSRIAEESETAWRELAVPEIVIPVTQEDPTIWEQDLDPVLDRIESFIEQGPVDVAYTDSHSKRDYTWVLTTKDIGAWIEPQKNDEGQIVLGLKKDNVTSFLEDRGGSTVNRSAKNAKFEIGSDGKVSEFQGSRPGVALKIDETYDAINNALRKRTDHDEGTPREVAVVTEEVEPETKTGDVNDLGIKEVLGVGYSNFSGSPRNRIKNIQFAINNKLNGLLIKPDEEFSLIKALEPFTLEEGYLPELVIKGDEIKPEVAGGLCQIGSTMFRAAMNSGMPITQRRNHSLVVSYYNDHRNGLPGTDATIYDPAPDFRFKNDTGHYMLLTTDVNLQKRDIYFTLWGTSDGREASYTKPTVSRWIPAGEPKEVETTGLKPGERECQSAHTGAVASFIYKRTLPDGEVVDRVFESYYRPLPRICLVGVDETPEEIPDFIVEDLGLAPATTETE